MSTSLTDKPTLVARDETPMPPREAAAFLGVSPGTLARWRGLGRGPAYTRAGARIIYLKGDLLAYQGQRRCSPDQGGGSDEVDRTIARIVDEAPALSPAQLDRLRGILGGAAA